MGIFNTNPFPVGCLGLQLEKQAQKEFIQLHERLLSNMSVSANEKIPTHPSIKNRNNEIWPHFR